MIISVILAVLMILLTEGVGIWTLDLMHVKREGYSAPIGTAILFCLLQLIYLPALLLHWNILYINIVTAAVLVLCLYFPVKRRKDIRASLFRRESIYILISAALFMFLLSNYDINVIMNSDFELARMNSLLGSRHIFLETFHLQGYTLLGTFFNWADLSGESVMAVYILGILIHCISAMLYMNIIDSFSLRNPWFKFTIVVGALFYLNFYSWKIAGAFHGSNWRIVFIAMMLFCAYQWIRKENEQIKYLLLFFSGAGMFCHPSFSILSLEIILCITVFTFHEEKIRSLFDFTTFIIPHVIYCACLFGYGYAWVGWLLIAAYTAFCFMRYKKKPRRMLVRAEDFLIEHHAQIFLIAIPAAAVAVTLFLRLFFPGMIIPYSRYLKFFNIKPAKIYLFLHSSALDMILDVIRWLGFILLLTMAKDRENRMVRYLYLLMAVFFLNPLCMGIIAKTTGTVTYAGEFEILFNPFTDIAIFVALYHVFEWKTLLQWVLEISLVFVALAGHIGSFMRKPFGLYTDLLQDSEVVVEMEQ